MLITSEYIVIVVGIITRLKWLLYAATRWSIVTCYGQSYQTTIIKLYLLLYQTLTKRTTSNNDSTVVILHSTSKNLSCRGCPFIDEYNHWYMLIASFPIATIIFTWTLTALRIYYQSILWKELISHLYRSLQYTASIITKVNNQVVGTSDIKRL